MKEIQLLFITLFVNDCNDAPIFELTFLQFALILCYRVSKQTSHYYNRVICQDALALLSSTTAILMSHKSFNNVDKTLCSVIKVVTLTH
jgi:hypothetical protein